MTVVVPIDNEEMLLPYSLPSIYALHPDEVLLLLDRCTDNSKRVCGAISSKYMESRTELIEVTDEIVKGWKSRIAAIRRRAFSASKNDLILNTDADIVLDPKIAKYLDLIEGHVALVKLGFFDYPFNIQSFSKRIISSLTPSFDLFKGFAGLYAFSKKAWQECESQDLVRRTEAEDSFLQISIADKYGIVYRNTSSLHLRASETKEKSFWRGREYFSTVHASFPSTFLHTFFMLRPYLLSGYLYARRKARDNTWKKQYAI